MKRSRYKSGPPATFFRSLYHSDPSIGDRPALRYKAQGCSACASPELQVAMCHCCTSLKHAVHTSRIGVERLMPRTLSQHCQYTASSFVVHVFANQGMPRKTHLHGLVQSSFLIGRVLQKRCIVTIITASLQVTNSRVASAHRTIVQNSILRRTFSVCSHSQERRRLHAIAPHVTRCCILEVVLTAQAVLHLAFRGPAI